MAARILYALFLVLLVFWTPWWLPVVFGLAGLVRFPAYYELILPAFIFDTLYAVTGTTTFAFPLLMTVLAIAGAYLSEEFRRQLLFSSLP